MTQAPMILARKLALAVLLLLGAAAPAAAAELLMFDDPACVWCKRWHAEIGPGYPRSAEGRIAPLRRVHARDQASLGVVLAAPVQGTPTFVLVDAGREVGRIRGYPGADYFYPMLGELLAKLPAAEPPRTPLLRSTAAPAPFCAAC